MKHICFIMLILASLHAASQSGTQIKFKETYSDTERVKIDTILLMGYGPSTTRIFLNDLSEQLINKWKEKKIVATYYYLGKQKDEAQKVFDSIDLSRSKLVLAFLPAGEALFQVTNSRLEITSYTRHGFFAPSSGSMRMSYKQDFTIDLYSSDNGMMRIWSAVVSVTSDPSKSKAAKKVADNILTGIQKVALAD